MVRVGEVGGDIGGDGGGDEDLLGTADHRGQRLSTGVIKLGENIIEDQDRDVATSGKQPEDGDFQGDGKRPRLTVGGKPLGGGFTEIKTQVIFVGADEGAARVDLAGADLRQRGEQQRPPSPRWFPPGRG